MNKRQYITVEATADVYVKDIIGDIETDDLVAELATRADRPVPDMNTTALYYETRKADWPEWVRRQISDLLASMAGRAV